MAHKKHLHGQGAHHKGGHVGGLVRAHHTPSVTKTHGTHHTHHHMNKLHGTPGGFATADKGYEDVDPPAGIQDDSHDHLNEGRMTDGCA